MIISLVVSTQIEREMEKNNKLDLYLKIKQILNRHLDIDELFGCYGKRTN